MSLEPAWGSVEDRETLRHLRYLQMITELQEKLYREMMIPLWMWPARDPRMDLVKSDKEGL